MGFLKSKSSTVLTGSPSIETTKKGRGSGGMRKRLGSRDQLRQTPSASSAAARNNTPDSREDQGTEDAARGKTRSRSQQQKKPSAAGNKKKAAGGKSKPSESKPRQGGQKQQRQKSRSRGRRPSADRSIEYENSYSASYSSYDSEDEVTDRTSFGYNSTFESEDEVTEKTSFDSPANRRRLAKSAKRQAEARKARGRSKGASGGRKRGSTPPPRPESPVASPVEAAGRALDKLGELINPQPSDAEETNPSTLESGGRSQVIDFVVQNEANQLMIQNAEHGNVEKLHLHVSFDGFSIPRLSFRCRYSSGIAKRTLYRSRTSPSDQHPLNISPETLYRR